MRSDNKKKGLFKPKGKHAQGANRNANIADNKEVAEVAADSEILKISDIAEIPELETEDTPEKKKKDKKKKTKSKKRKVIKRIILVVLCLGIIMCGALGVFVWKTISEAPDIDPENLYTLLSESTVIYDADGKQIDTVYTDSNRDNVEYEQLPKNLVNAVVALEDKTFWKHHGFNFVRILGAVKDKIIHGGRVSGTSTITQQLARNLYLKDSRFEYDYRRKIIEAYYAIIIEKNLTKEEIISAYLNTIDFGYHTSGVQAASKAYFSKDVSKLTLAQCAALAALPQAPSAYQLVEFYNKGEIDKNDKNILKKTFDGYWVANEASKDRRITCLELMLEQGYITEKQFAKASKKPLRKILKPTYETSSGSAAYFADYVINEVIDDLMDKKGWDYDTAYQKVYNGGLKIYSTLDSTAQSVIEKEFENSSNFPSLYASTDSQGNILNTYGSIALYDYDDYFDSDGNFNFKKSEARVDKNGNLILKSGKRLNFYDTEVNGEIDYSLEFKPMYVYDDGELCSINGGFINVPQNYKSRNKYDNIVISKEFFEDENYEGYFKFNDDGTVTLTGKGYTLEQKVVQPQAAMAIVENSSGYIKALVGGRKTSGRKLYNRATSTRQPGSSIKPLGVYSAALQQSCEEQAAGQKHTFTNFNIDKQGKKYWGNYLTAGSIVIDEKTTINGEQWPHNAGGGYSGPQTLRTALQQSLNTCAVKIIYQVGTDYSADLVKKFGITTLDLEGETNDNNAAALALGGMSNGVTPLEMASAYTTFPNNGVRYKTTSYVKVVDNSGKALLKNKKNKKKSVLDPGVAWIMTDMLKSVVTNGLGAPAAISGVQVGGKTGTTDNEVDIWFDGFTPNYSAALWIGNDQNFELTGLSDYAARLWGRIMDQIPNAKKGSYKSAPSNVIRSGGEYYISGTQGGIGDISKLKKKISICKDSGFLATPDCPHVENKTMFEIDKVPKYYCHLHNSNPEKYPPHPDKQVVVPEKPDPVKPEDPVEPDDPDDGEDDGNDGDDDNTTTDPEPTPEPDPGEVTD